MSLDPYISLDQWVNDNADHLRHVGPWVNSIVIDPIQYPHFYKIPFRLQLFDHPESVDKGRPYDNSFYDPTDPTITRLLIASELLFEEYKLREKNQSGQMGTRQFNERVVTVNWLVREPVSDPELIGLPPTQFEMPEHDYSPDADGWAHCERIPCPPDYLAVINSRQHAGQYLVDREPYLIPKFRWPAVVAKSLHALGIGTKEVKSPNGLVIRPEAPTNAEINATAFDNVDDEALLSAKKIAELANRPYEAVRKRLGRWQKSGGDGCIENIDRKPNEPEYHFRVGWIRHIIKQIKVSS